MTPCSLKLTPASISRCGRSSKWLQTGNGLVKLMDISVQYLTWMGSEFTKVLSHVLTRQMDGPECDWTALPA